MFEQPLTLLARYDAFIIIVEALIIGLYLWRMHQVRAVRISVYMVTKGMLAKYFWGGVVVAGFIVPFASAIYGNYLSAAEPTLILTILSSIIGLMGGFTLRYVVVASGASMPLNVNGILIPVPKTSKTEIAQRVIS